MIMKIKNKTKKTFAVKKKKEKSTDVEMVDAESEKLKTKIVSKKRPMTSDVNSSAPKKKKLQKEDTEEKSHAKTHGQHQDDKGKVKTLKQEAEEAKEKKKLRKMREKKFYEVREEVKKLWEELRKMDLESRRRQQVTDEMFKLVLGKAVHLIFAHDTSRCIQTLVKFGSASQRESLFLELKGGLLKMMKSKFAKFCVRKFLKYGSKRQREEVFNIFKGNVAVLLKHKEASGIVEMAYNDYANVQQRNCMEEEFYGPVFLLHKTSTIKSLGAFRKEYPDKVPSLVHHMKDRLVSLVEKSILQLSLVHKLLFDFFELANDASKSELVDALKEHLPHLLHTRNGSRVAMRCLWSGSAKDRKVMVKSLKTYVLKASQEEQGHLVLLALLDCIDDTRLVCKAIIDEFVKDLDEVVDNQYSRKVLLYLLAPRNAMFFHPDVIKVLSHGDTNPHSKKDTQVRRSELLSYLSTPLLKWTVPNVKKLTSNNNLLLLLQAIVNNVKGDSSELLKQVAVMVAEPFPAKGFHFIDDSSGHLVLKKMIGRPTSAKKSEKDEDENKDESVDDNGAVVEAGGGEETPQHKTSFAEVLMQEVTEENIQSWVRCNRGCFVLVLLLELGEEGVSEKVRGALKSMKGSLKKEDSKGAQLLLKKLH